MELLREDLRPGSLRLEGDQGDEHYMHLNRFEELVAIPLPASKTIELVRGVTDSGYSIKWIKR